MRKSKLLAQIVVFILLASACNEDDGPKEVTEAFEATFFTALKGFEENGGSCSSPHNFLNTQEGEGTATQLGSFTTVLTFCVNPMNFEYVDTEGSFVASNGDEIFITGRGQILPSTKDGYDLEFFDDFKITGGTGSFASATGNLTSESYVNMTTGQTDHVWSGTIAYMK